MLTPWTTTVHNDAARMIGGRCYMHSSFEATIKEAAAMSTDIVKQQRALEIVFSPYIPRTALFDVPCWKGWLL